MKKGIHVYYSGRVQGVGFRFTARELAGDYNLAGWIRNLHDGRVELAAEAEEEELQAFLASIERHFHSYIQDIDVKWQESSGECKGFRIRF
ncbi:acylphosphatase [Candidatus Omnitrophota bacterium]